MKTEDCSPYLRDDCTSTTTGTCCEYGTTTTSSTIPDPELPDTGSDTLGLVLLGGFSLLFAIICFALMYLLKELDKQRKDI